MLCLKLLTHTVSGVSLMCMAEVIEMIPCTVCWDVGDEVIYLESVYCRHIDYFLGQVQLLLLKESDMESSKNKRNLSMNNNKGVCKY